MQLGVLWALTGGSREGRIGVKRTTSALLGAAVVLGMAGLADAKTVIQVEFIADRPVEHDVIAAFEQANPDISIEATYNYNPSDKFTNQVLGGTAPDIVAFDRYRVGEYAQSGMLQPIDTYLAGTNLSATFLAGPLHEATFGGKLYAVPIDTDIRGLYWNKEMLSAAGLADGPKSWADLNGYADKLTINDGQNKLKQVGFIPWSGNWSWVGWMWTFGGDYFDMQAMKPTLNRPENVAALEWQADYAKKFGTFDGLNGAGFGSWGDNGFLNGKVAMVASDNYGIPSHNPAFAYGAGEVPHPDGGVNGTWSGGMAYVVPKDTPQSDAIGRFLRFVIQDQQQLARYKSIGALPATQSAIQTLWSQSTPLQQAFLAQSAVSHWRYPFTGLLWGIVGGHETKVYNLQETPQAALDNAQQEALNKYAGNWGQK